MTETMTTSFAATAIMIAMQQENDAVRELLAEAAAQLRSMKERESRIRSLVTSIRPDKACPVCKGAGTNEVWIHDDPHTYPCLCTYPEKLMLRVDR